MQKGCKDCLDRKVGCHTGCERYDEFCKENERIKANRKAFNEGHKIDVEIYIRSQCQKYGDRKPVKGFQKKRKGR